MRHEWEACVLAACLCGWAVKDELAAQPWPAPPAAQARDPDPGVAACALPCAQLKDRPSAQAVAVKSSLGSQYGRGAVSAGDSFMALITKLVPLERVRRCAAPALLLPRLCASHPQPSRLALPARWSAAVCVPGTHSHFPHSTKAAAPHARPTLKPAAAADTLHYMPAVRSGCLPSTRLLQLKEIEGTPGYSEALEAFAPKNAASRQRPELASPLSRFDPSYDAAPAAAGGGGSAGAAVPGGSSSSGSGAGAAVAEARCEVCLGGVFPCNMGVKMVVSELGPPAKHPGLQLVATSNLYASSPRCSAACAGSPGQLEIVPLTVCACRVAVPCAALVPV